MAPFIRQKPIDYLRVGAIQAFTPTCTFQFIIFRQLLLRLCVQLQTYVTASAAAACSAEWNKAQWQAPD